MRILMFVVDPAMKSSPFVIILYVICTKNTIYGTKILLYERKKVLREEAKMPLIFVRSIILLALQAAVPVELHPERKSQDQVKDPRHQEQPDGEGNPFPKGPGQLVAEQYVADGQ